MLHLGNYLDAHSRLTPRRKRIQNEKNAVLPWLHRAFSHRMSTPCIYKHLQEDNQTKLFYAGLTVDEFDAVI